ncbi:hypothetical protein P0489_00840, partial [Campylobacter jejuni]|nr:hypothetical protein [Campylobacter jejuni]
AIFRRQRQMCIRDRFILFHFAATIEKIVGKLILHVFSRIAQVFIVAMGFKMIIVGLKDIFNL